MALFGAPIAYEDHAPRAVLAALGLLRRHAGTADRRGYTPTASTLAVRMGLNTGAVVVGGIGDNLTHGLHGGRRYHEPGGAFAATGGAWHHSGEQSHCTAGEKPCLPRNTRRRCT